MKEDKAEIWKKKEKEGHISNVEVASWKLIWENKWIWQLK